jgi:predicted metal-dependent peptidase
MMEMNIPDNDMPRTLSQAEQLAFDILELSRNTLMVHLRFLQPALMSLSFCADPEQSLATDCRMIYFRYDHILRSYRQSKERVMRDYLHTVLHCIYHHPFVGKNVDPDLWNLACDIAVEATIQELGLPDTGGFRSPRQGEMIEGLRKDLSSLTAEKIYHELRAADLKPEIIRTTQDLFLADDHRMWYQLTQIPDSSEDSEQQHDDSDESDSDHLDSTKSDSQNSSSDDNRSEKNESKDASETIPEDENSASKKDQTESSAPSSNTDSDHGAQKKLPDLKITPHGALSPVNKDQTQKTWDSICARIQTDLETASRHWAEKAGNLLTTLQFLNRERLDYRAFLRQFSTFGEEVHVNDEEFDYIFYTYGLKLYENMPLVEPLEYQEVKKIREFVIAIDTSASVKGELVEQFLRSTCEILLQEDTWFSRIELHIIQCDSIIQSDTRITGSKDLEEYLHSLEIKGCGGTDFRPVFEYIAELQKQHQLTNLKGLLYFTDGDGIYPAAEPPYRTVFLFMEQQKTIPRVPVWAIRAILSCHASGESCQWQVL